MALAFTIQEGTPPPPTTPLAGGAFNGIVIVVYVIVYKCSLRRVTAKTTDRRP